MDELRRWLECRGQKKGGNKEELIIRVRGMMSIEIPIDPKVDGGKWYNIKALKTKNVNHLLTATCLL